MTKSAEARLIRTLEKKLDIKASLYVRALAWDTFGGKCPLCNRGPIIPCKPCKRNKFATECQAIQCCFHFIRRIRKATRWHPLNMIGACHGCNRMEYRDPDSSRVWFIRILGIEAYLNLFDQSREKFYPTVEYLENRIKSYDEGLASLLLLDSTRTEHNPVLLSLRKK